MVADPRNARAHDEQNLAASLARYGQRKPVVVNRRNGQIEAGNGTVIAAAELGWSHVAVVWVEDDAATQHGYAVTDNRTAEMAEWNQDVLDELLAEYSDEFAELSDALLLDELASQPEDVDETPLVSDAEPPEPPADPVTQPGDLWMLGEHRLLCGDCTSRENAARLFAGEKVDLCFTSPPYGIDKSARLRDHITKGMVERKTLYDQHDDDKGSWPG